MQINKFISQKAQSFGESMIRNMSLICREYQAVNWAQGLPEDQTSPELKAAALAAIAGDFNQYARTFGIPELTQAVAERMAEFQGYVFDPETQVTICCGGTEAMIAAFLATLNPGDEVLVFYPYYENYRAELLLAGAIPRYVEMLFQNGQFVIDFEQLSAAFGPKTKGLIINTPHNPTGKVFSREELVKIAELCIAHDILVYTDETYEYIVYPPHQHLCPAVLPGMAERTVVISSLSKTYAATGWRIAWAIAPPEITQAIRNVHDFLTISAPHPLQKAAVTALQFPESYYAHLLTIYLERRTLICEGLQTLGLDCIVPEGAYYTLVDISDLCQSGETEFNFALRLVKEAGVGGVPGSSFMPEQHRQPPRLRFGFCKSPETLAAGLERLQAWL